MEHSGIEEKHKSGKREMPCDNYPKQRIVRRSTHTEIKTTDQGLDQLHIHRRISKTPIVKAG